LAIPIELNDLDDGGLRFIATGVLTGKEILDANKTIYETEEKTLASVYQICDYRGVETVDVSTDDIRTLAERDKRAARINPNNHHRSGGRRRTGFRNDPNVAGIDERMGEWIERLPTSKILNPVS